MTVIQDFIDRIFEDQYQTQFGPAKSLAEQSDTVTLTREVAGELVAVLQARISLANAHITSLVVAPSQQGQGLGRSLLGEFEGLAKDRGITSITLSTKSYQAEGFYKIVGYQVYGELQDVPQKGITKYHMVKYLS
ncbi:GNAT family N-acetyltransferase [Streptococcus moroccensis]|uniref:Ribosomal protein S18 acetylase RimI-like enzyme n=1 Tax=Streptococcus moroccensis TaxID=1451356 RepID=A0ABT9YNR3_9STRE|nr:GNAT family N-acetyltransferase [Streptococcus moroccensis]MDQ0221537.1 ribosomal protein S18 acetylase RimI-like enzyme [Streptococcus moroccensis]